MISLHQHNASEVFSLAQASNEPFRDVMITTARSFFVKLAYEAAADLVYREGHTLSEEKVHAVAVAMIADRKLMVQEHVRVSGPNITVCLDIDNVDGDDVMWLALDRVASALDQLDGESGVVTYGADLVFTVDQVSWLMLG
jgi:hypothetical protein